MSLTRLPVNFHDSQLAMFSVGPRKEVTLCVALDPVWNKEAKTVVVRLSAIENMPVVSAFFQKLELPADSKRFVSEIVQLAQPKKDVVLLELADHGSVEIHSRKISLS